MNVIRLNVWKVFKMRQVQTERKKDRRRQGEIWKMRQTERDIVKGRQMG